MTMPIPLAAWTQVCEQAVQANRVIRRGKRANDGVTGVN